MTLYRKYRPQKIEELDIEEVKKRLSTVLSSGHIPHAFLFSGPKGTGKTSAARIVAKILNCEKTGKAIQNITSGQRFKTTFEPCNVCSNCISITQGQNLDVLEIDAASNRGIDEIRDLREKIGLAPASSFYKVYIIDEVHMLTTEAFNALLKTLEEPPLHVIFILATTEADKLLPTIISRCTRFEFTKATNGEIQRSLKRVVKGEKLKIENEDELLQEIANAADGSFRDATKLFEQAMDEDALSIEKIRPILGSVSEVAIQHFITYLSTKDAKKSLAAVEELTSKGVTMKSFMKTLLETLHSMLLAKYDVVPKDNGNQTEWSSEEIKRVIKVFSKAYMEIRSSTIASLPIEIAVVEWCENK